MALDPQIPKHIRSEAARWITERDADLLTEEDEAAFLVWLNADPLHEAAYRRLERSWHAAKPPYVRPVVRGDAPKRGRRWMGGAVAACLMFGTIASVYDVPMRLRADAMTVTGEQRAITLPDGSIARLNTASAIAVDYGAGKRSIRLLQGEAAFTVTPDRSHPFTVWAGTGATTALGTRFIVRLEGVETDVAVTEHRVRVRGASEEGVGTWSVVVGEGETVRYGANGPSLPRRIDPHDAEAWLRGRLVFVDRPLAEVVSELDRYHPGYIRIVGDTLAKRRFSGVLPLNDPMSALETIQRSLDIGSTRFTDRLIFLHS